MTTDTIIGIIYACIAHHLSNSSKMPESDKNNKQLEYPIFTLGIDPHDHITLEDIVNTNKALILTQLCSEEPTITLDGYTLTFCPFIPKQNFKDL